MILNGLTKNISAMNIRIGNTFNIKFAITKAGEPYDLNDKDLILIMTNKVKRSEIVVEEYTIIGDNNNVLYWTFEGKDQIDRGQYILTLYENHGQLDMMTVDCCDAFNLVARSCEEDGQSTCGNVEVEVVEVTADFREKGEKGDKGDDGDSAYQVAVKNGFTGTEQEWLDSLIGSDGQDGQDGADGQNATINGYNAITIVVEDGLSISQEQGTITISSPNLANKADKEELKGLMTKIAQDWNELNTYKRGNWVWHNGCYYHAKQDVPANIEINNTTYWENINDFSAKANHVKTIELEPQYTEFVIGGSIKVDQSFRMMSFVKDVKVKRDTEGHSQLYDSRGKVASEVSLGDKENKNNKVQSLSSSSTHDQYPTAKCVYDMIGNIETLLAAI